MTTEEKAHRMLAEGRLTIDRVDPVLRLVAATCRGYSDGEVYSLGYDPRPDHEGWRCTCEASAKFRRRCSHLIALQLCVVKPKGTP